MTNSLRKSTRYTLLPERAAQAAVPYRPAQAARMATERKEVCRLVAATSGGNSGGLVKVVRITDDETWVTYAQVDAFPPTTRTVRVCEMVTTTVFYPATPEQKAAPGVTYRPQTVVEEFALGWNSGARSINSIAGDGAATFKVPSAVGVVAGFNTQDRDAGYVEIEHGIYFRRRTFSVIEGGVEKTLASSFAATDVFKIERAGDVVNYYQNATLLYTSLVASTGPVFLDTSMYSGGDTIDDPALTGSTLLLTGVSNAAMRPLGGFSSESGWDYSRGSMLPMSGSASGGALAPKYALSAGQMMPLYGYAYGPEVRYGTSHAVMPPMTGMAVDKKYGESRGSMLPMLGYAADRSFLQLPQAPMPTPSVSARGGASATLTMPAPVFSAYAAPTNLNAAQLAASAGVLTAAAGAYATAISPVAVLNASATTTLLAGAQMVAPAATLDASGTVSLTAQVELTLPRPCALIGYAGAVVSVTIGACTMQASGTSTIAGAAQLTLPLYELNASASVENFGRAELLAPAMAATPWVVAWLMSPAPTLTAVGTAVVAVTYEAYAVNLRSELEGGGNEVTRYTGYPFERIVRWRGNYYGMAADGLYLLEGGTDDGEPIEWALRTGTTDFGKSQKKNTASGYVGGRMGPATTFTVLTGEKQENNYPYTTPRGSTAQNYRQKFGRGLDARYYAFQLEGDGELEIDDFDIEVVMRTRRI